MPITSQQLGPWQRRLVPSLTDLLFVVLAASQFGRRLFADADTGWHLWAGMDVLARGPRVIPDTLSFTRPGAPWRDVEWLADAILALGQRHAGYLGIALLTTLVFAGTFAWLYRVVLRETGHAPAAAAATMLAALVGALQVLARPVIFSFALVLAVWECVRVPGRERRALWLAPLLTVLWANLHPSALLAPLLVLFAWLARGRDRRLGIALLLSIGALGCTPWGYGWLRDLIPTGDNLLLFRNIDEWQTPHFSEPRTWFTLVLVLVAIGARRAGPRLTPWETLLGLACLLGSLLALRLGPVAAILWAPFLARDLAALWTQRGGGWVGGFWRAAQETLIPFERVLRPGLWPLVLTVGLLIAAPRLERFAPGVALGFPADSFPRQAMSEAGRLGLGPRVLNGYGWGGYIAWGHGGRWKVFIDGRAGFFGGDVLADYLCIVQLRPGWQEALERRRPDWMLLQQEAPLVDAAVLTGGWRMAYRDSIAAILIPVRTAGPAR